MATIESIIDQLDSLTPASLEELANFLEYLAWKQAPSLTTFEGQPWQYDFVEHFRSAVVTASHDLAGMEVQIGEASCDKQSRMALWQHPPVQGASVVEYQVPVPSDAKGLRLAFATGIRDGSELARGNVVAFRLYVNGWKLWSDTQNTRAWKEHMVAMPALPGDAVRIQFVTDGLGNHQWAWAAWADPRILGTKQES